LAIEATLKPGARIEIISRFKIRFLKVETDKLKINIAIIYLNFSKSDHAANEAG
jgi:hypothetical protein